MFNQHIKDAIAEYIRDQQIDAICWCDRTALLDEVSHNGGWERTIVDYSLWEMLESGEVVWENQDHLAVCLREIANPPVEGYGEG